MRSLALTYFSSKELTLQIYLQMSDVPTHSQCSVIATGITAFAFDLACHTPATLIPYITRHHEPNIISQPGRILVVMAGNTAVLCRPANQVS